MLQAKRKKNKKIKFILKLFASFLLLFILGFLALFFYHAKDLPRPERFAERELFQGSRIYDRTGNVVLFEIYGEEKRTPISLDQVPTHLKQAVIVAEDSNFYHHFGLCFRGILRATLVNLRMRKVVQGGSTISQQLIRSTFLRKERTLGRKIREIILTLELERRYSKCQILEWYLNQIPFGLPHGIEAASQRFFDKSASDLSLSESATLVALIRAPSRLSAPDNREKLLIRRNHILNRMVQENYLTLKQADIAQKEKIEFASPLTTIKAPHFTLYVKQYLIDKYGRDFLRRRGLRVITSLDWELQQLAEETFKQKIEANRAHDAHNIALAAIDPTTGHILALKGSVDWFKNPYPKGCRPGIDCLIDPKFNAASHTGRQPGSAFKPFIFAAAFENNLDINDETIVIDKETNFGIWGGELFIPQNFDQKFRGKVTLRQILAQSLNVPTVKILRDLVGLESFPLGIEKSVDLSEDLGITTLQPPHFYGPSFALGVIDINLIDMVSAYGVFAFEGLKVAPVSILRIEDAQGNIIEENKKTPKRVLSRRTSRLINDILSDKEARAPIFGKKLDLRSNSHNYNVAVKTGTTDEYRDGWTIGYTFGNTFNNNPLVVGVWAGNSDNSPTRSPGLILAAPTWRAFMEGVLF